VDDIQELTISSPQGKSRRVEEAAGAGRMGVFFKTERHFRRLTPPYTANGLFRRFRMCDVWAWA